MKVLSSARWHQPAIPVTSIVPLDSVTVTSKAAPDVRWILPPPLGTVGAVEINAALPMLQLAV